jgi:hypothetical protein
MILHFSHMGLTDGRTFMFPFDWIPSPGSGCRSGRRYRAQELLAARNRAKKRDPAW